MEKLIEITVLKGEVNVYWWKKVEIWDSSLSIWWDTIMTWKDDHTKKCEKNVIVNGKEIKTWETISEWWKMEVIITDEKWETSRAEILLNCVDETPNEAPEITVLQDKINVYWGKKLEWNDNSLKIWWQVVMTWKDDHTESCTVQVSFNGKELKNGDVLGEVWTIIVSIMDEKWKTSKSDINLYIEDNTPNEAPQVTALKEKN